MFGMLPAAYAAKKVDEVQGVRIDIWDSSNGQRPPVFAVTRVQTALASAFLWFSHGSNQLGCYSLTTGAQKPCNGQRQGKCSVSIRWNKHCFRLSHSN